MNPLANCKKNNRFGLAALNCYVLIYLSFLLLFVSFLEEIQTCIGAFFQAYLPNYSTRGQCSQMNPLLEIKKKNLLKTLKLR